MEKTVNSQSFEPSDLLEFIEDVLDGCGLVVTDTDLLEEAIWSRFKELESNNGE